MIQFCEVETEHGCICYQLERKNVRNINLRIRTDASVYVSAPKDVPESVVTQFVKRRSRYIAEAQQQFREFRQYAPQPRHYVSGESFSVLGRSLRLRVEQGKKDDIRSDGVYLYLTVKDTEDQEQKKRLVDRYLNKVCREIFQQTVNQLYPIFRKYGVPSPRIHIRSMDTRWGSCLPQKAIITLNRHLLEMPSSCIEYVVLHEFCHFLYPNHSKDFYAILTTLMPDWQQRKKLLDKNAQFEWSQKYETFCGGES